MPSRERTLRNPEDDTVVTVFCSDLAAAELMRDGLVEVVPDPADEGDGPQPTPGVAGAGSSINWPGLG